MPVMSNLLVLKASAFSAWSGPIHQVTRAETAPARTAAASSSHPVLTASQCRLVTLWVQANWLVPVSSSCATIGAPQNIPASSGTADVAATSVVKAVLLRDRLPQLLCFMHPARAECHTCAACSPVISSTTVSAASSAAASAPWLRYCRQVTQVIGLLPPLTGGLPRGRRRGRPRPGPCSRALSPPGPVPRRPRRDRSPARSA